MSDTPLPSGWTCGDCIHLKEKCSWLNGAEAENTFCRFDPPRFVGHQSPNWFSHTGSAAWPVSKGPPRTVSVSGKKVKR